MNEKKYIYYRESFIQSLMSDIFSCATLAFCIWFSNGDKVWTFVCVVLFFAVIGSETKRASVFTSRKKMLEYIKEELEGEDK